MITEEYFGDWIKVIDEKESFKVTQLLDKMYEEKINFYKETDYGVC